MKTPANLVTPIVRALAGNPAARLLAGVVAAALPLGIAALPARGAEGDLDVADFGNKTVSHSGVSSLDSSGVSLAIQSDGKILLAGMDTFGSVTFAARFFGTPVPVTPVPTLNAPGFVLVALLMLLAVARVAGRKKQEFG